MSTSYPGALDTFVNPTPTSDTVIVPHSSQHTNINDAVTALENKVGINSSAVTTSFDYKLGEITGTDKAVGKSAAQTLLNKIFGTGTAITLGSDALGDIYFRNVSNLLSRLGIGSSGQVLTVTSGIPSWQSPSSTNTGYAADSGAANAYVVTLSPALASYTAGTLVQFKATNANTTASTVNVNGLGAKTIKKLGGATDLVSGDIAAGMIVELEYDGTNFVMLNPVATTLTFLNFFGDGSDGDVTIGSNTSLTRDMYYNNLTISSTFTLSTAGYRIFVKGVLSNSGTIANNGNAGSAGGAGSAGVGGTAGSGGAAPAAVTVIAGQAGTNGGVGGSANASGAVGTNGTAQTNSVGTAGGTGGVGGTATGNGTVTSGIAGVVGTLTSSSSNIRDTSTALSLQNITGVFKLGTAGTGASGGSASSASGNASAGGGGGGGSTGGMVFIVAKTITGAGAVNAIGGNGGNGGNGSSSGGAGNSGQGGGATGGGGSGGIVLIISNTAVNPMTVGVAGGTAGATPGTGSLTGTGTGASGALGTNGSAGLSFYLTI
jgi:hypothetical protein